MTAAPPSTENLSLVVFLLDGQRFGLELRAVQRVVRMVAITALPRAPAVISGVVDIAGQLTPVFNARRRFGLPDRAPRLQDQLLIVQAARYGLALPVDAVEPVLTVPSSAVTLPEEVVPGLEQVRGLVRVPTLGIVLVQSLDRFLSLEQAAALAAALAEEEP